MLLDLHLLLYALAELAAADNGPAASLFIIVRS